MILCDCDRTVDPCCDNLVGLVFSDLWSAIIFILCFVYFDHNGGSASTQCPRFFFCIAQNAKWTDSENNKQGFALDVIFQNETVFNFCLKKGSPFFP